MIKCAEQPVKTSAENTEADSWTMRDSGNRYLDKLQRKPFNNQTIGGDKFASLISSHTHPFSKQ